MLNEILDAVIKRIHELFGENAVVHTEPLEQGFERPCFFVGFFDPSEKQMIGQRYLKTAGVTIRYVPPEAQGRNRALYDAFDVLNDGMEMILLSDGSRIRGNKRNGKILDDCLDFFVTYKMFVIKKNQTEETMDRLEYQADIMKGKVN